MATAYLPSNTAYHSQGMPYMPFGGYPLSHVCPAAYGMPVYAMMPQNCHMPHMASQHGPSLDQRQTKSTAAEPYMTMPCTPTPGAVPYPYMPCLPVPNQTLDPKAIEMIRLQAFEHARQEYQARLGSVKPITGPDVLPEHTQHNTEDNKPDDRSLLDRLVSGVINLKENPTKIPKVAVHTLLYGCSGILLASGVLGSLAGAGLTAPLWLAVAGISAGASMGGITGFERGINNEDIIDKGTTWFDLVKSLAYIRKY